MKRASNISEKKIALGGTFFVHLIGILVMFLYSISVEKKELSGVIEMRWGNGTMTSSLQHHRNTKNGNSSTSLVKKKTNMKRVKLPTRVMNDRTKTTSRIMQAKKNNVEASSEKRLSELRRQNISRVDDVPSNAKNSVYGTDEFVSDNSLGAVGYSISWSGGMLRKKMYGNLPAYPEGVNIKAQVKIQAVVFPDGSVGKCVPLLTADRRLVNAALEEVRTWKFSPLEKRYKQSNQKCVITFNFRLE
ncbi:MAG: hypothetical protein FJ218_01355 [Ignavibacteria bacterium]|nr:hypothetical protein [Ignavibacteria bacterium]